MTVPVIHKPDVKYLGTTGRFSAWTGPQKAQMLAGALLLLMGLALNLYSRTKGINDVRWTYTLARLIMAGEHGYSPSVMHDAFEHYHSWPGMNYMPYPPSTGIVMLPLSLFSVNVASIGWFLVLYAGTIVSVWATMRVFAPETHLSRIILIMGLVTCAACTRWGFTSLQAAPAVNAMLALFLLALYTGREQNALVAGTIGLCIKITNGLPFVVIALVQRRFRLAAAMLGLCLLVNVGGFARLGGLGAIQDYRMNVAQTETKDNSVNYPDPHERYALVRLDWQYLLNGIAPNVSRNRQIAGILTILGLLWVGAEAWRYRRGVRDAAALGAFLGPVVCLSLLTVYHHHYEASVLILPILGYAYGPDEIRSLPGARAFIWVVTPYVLFYAVGIENVVARKFGMGAMQYPRLLGSLFVAIALFASLWALRKFVDGRRYGVAVDELPTEFVTAN